MDARAAHDLGDEVLFVDVRESYEFKAGHIRGSTHIPLAELPGRVDDLVAADHVVTICKVGARSDEAARFLKSFGVKAENLDGGVMAWARDGFELVTPDGKQGRVMT